jgi:hypothetical protein
MSAGVLRALVPLRVSGVPWLNGESKELPVSSMRANVLCQRHNSALSDLDSAAVKFIQAVRKDEEALLRLDLGSPKSGDEHDTLTLISGPVWERWMLKVLLGAMSAGALGKDSRRIESWAAAVDVPGLIETLFYSRPLPDGAGMAIREYDPASQASPGSVGIMPMSSVEQSGLIGVAIELGIIDVSLATVPTRDVLERRVDYITLQRKDLGVEKTFAFAWSSPAGHGIVLSNERPRAMGTPA